MSSVHCTGGENHMRMLPIVFNSIIYSHRILWFSLEITLACHPGRGWSTAEWKRERKNEMITVLPHVIGQSQTKLICIWRRCACSSPISGLRDLKRWSSKTLGNYDCVGFQPLFLDLDIFPFCFNLHETECVSQSLGPIWCPLWEPRWDGSTVPPQPQLAAWMLAP